MKTIDLSVNQTSLQDLLNAARQESIVVKAVDGTSFLLSLTDEFATEVELLRKNEAFLKLLDTCKQEQKTFSLEEVEERLR